MEYLDRTDAERVLETGIMTFRSVILGKIGRRLSFVVRSHEADGGSCASLIPT